MVDIGIEAEIYQDKGCAHFYKDEFNQAKLNYSRLIKLKDDRKSAIYFNWGVCQYYQKNYSQALRKYRLALQYDPNRSKAYNGWGSCLSNLGKFDEAIPKFHQALEIAPEYTLAHLNIVLAFFMKKEDEEALKYFENMKGKLDFFSEQDEMNEIYNYEMGLLDLRIFEATNSEEILLANERKQGVKRILNLLNEKDDKSEKVFFD